MGFRAERTTPKPNFLQLPGLDAPSDTQSHDTDNTIDLIDHYLMHYGNDNSVLDVSELDGFFAALACSPATLMSMGMRSKTGARKIMA